MSFNKGYEFKKFEQEWESEKKTMLIAGMKEDQINEIYEYERRYFNSRRRYEEHKAGDLCVEDFSIEEDFEQNIGFIDSITDKKLYIAVSRLKPSELELLKLYVVEGLKVTEIAKMKGKSKSTISEKISRIIEKVKKNYK